MLRQQTYKQQTVRRKEVTPQGFIGRGGYVQKTIFCRTFCSADEISQGRNVCVCTVTTLTSHTHLQYSTLYCTFTRMYPPTLILWYNSNSLTVDNVSWSVCYLLDFFQYFTTPTPNQSQQVVPQAPQLSWIIQVCVKDLPCLIRAGLKACTCQHLEKLSPGTSNTLDKSIPVPSMKSLQECHRQQTMVPCVWFFTNEYLLFIGRRVNYVLFNKIKTPPYNRDYQ
jgi:hypothetical protein